MSDISATVTKEGPVKRSLRVTVPPERVSNERKRVYANLRRNAQLPGFRKGKVPDSVLAQRYGKQVDADVVRHLVEAACGEALTQNDIEAVVPPRVTSHELSEENGLVFEATVEVRPEFRLRKYKGLKAVRKIMRVEDDHVARYLESLRERVAVLEVEEDRVNVAHGDVVTLDMYGLHEGQPVEEATAEGVQLEVGRGRFPEELEKQLVGVTRGIQTPILVRFPEDHPSEALRGNLVRLNVTVREIKNKVLPPLDDDLPGELGIDDCQSIDELRERVRKDLVERAQVEADRRMRGDLLDALVQAHGFEVPEGLVERRILGRLAELGVSELPREKFDEVRGKFEASCAKDVAAGFILDAVARAESLEVDREQLEQAIALRVRMAGERASGVRDHYSRPAEREDLRHVLLREKALELVAERATRRDEEVDESEVADQPG